MKDAPNIENEELETLVGQVADEYTDRINRGEQVDTDEYIRRYPKIAAVLRQMLPSLGLIGKLSTLSQAHGDVQLTAVPEVLGDFRVLREIGRGGMGVVYEAEQKSLGRHVALKILSPNRLSDPLCLKRFEREAHAAAGLHHTNIVPVFGVGEENGIHFYAMQFIEGHGLDRVIKSLEQGEKSALSDLAFDQYCQSVARIGAEVAAALAYAHGLGVVHRDIKPANLLLASDGRVWVTDFGLAKAESAEDLTQTGDLIGTLRYSAPERLGGHADARSDIFSLGLTLYELLARRPAFDEIHQGLLVQQVTNAAPPALRKLDRRMPADLETIVHKAIAKEPERRYQRAADFAEDLQRFLSDRPILARRTPWHVQSWRWCRRNPMVASLLAIVLLMTSAIAIGSTVTANRLHIGLMRVERAEKEANRRLYDSLLAQARAARWSGRAGQRFDSLLALSEAAHLIDKLELGPDAVMVLRNEAIACLALADTSIEQTWEPLPSDASHWVVWDERLDTYARSDRQGNVAVWKKGESNAVAQLTSLGHEPSEMFMSPCGKYVTIRHGSRARAEGGNVAVWDWSNSKAATWLPSVVADRAIAFSAKGDQLVAGLVDGGIVFYEMPAGREVRRIRVNQRPGPLSLAPKGDHLAISSPASLDVLVCDATSGKIAKILRAGGPINCLAWHPDGNLLAVACQDGHIYLWDCTSGKSQAVLTSVLSSAIRMSFSNSGDMLMTWSWDGAVRLWNPWTGQPLVISPGVNAHLSGDGRYLVARQASKLVLRKLASGGEYRTLSNPAAPSGKSLYYDTATLSSDRRWLIVGCNDGVRFWDLDAGKMPAFLPLGKVGYAHATQDVIFTFGPGGLYRWPFHRDQQVLTVGPPKRLIDSNITANAIANMDRNGSILALRTAGGVNLFDMKNDGATRRVVKDFGVGMTLSPDGAWFVGTPWNSTGLKIWDTRTAACVKDLSPDIRIATAFFSPRNDWLVIATATDYQFLQAGTWQPGPTVRRETDNDNPGPIAWSPDGSVLAITTSSRRIQLLEAATQLPLATLETPNADPVAWLDFSADSSQLIVVTPSPGCVRIWDLRMIREQLARLNLDWKLAPYAAPPTITPFRLNVQLGTAPKAPAPRKAMP